MPWWDNAVNTVSKAAVDTAGFATSTVAPAMQSATHAVAAGGLHAANAVTGGQIDGLKGAADDQEKKMHKAAKNAEAGFKHATNQTEPWFKEGPSNKGAWMKSIPDNRKITSLFLPGTHDSGARHGGDFAECQTWSLPDQLKAGIRCFDIRLRQAGDDALAVHHGVCFQHLFWNDVARAFEDFLKENKTEIIFVAVTDNGCSHDSSRNFREHFRSKVPKNSRWKLGADVGGETVGSLRGCVVGFASPFDNTTVDPQNEWENVSPDHKAHLVRSHGNKKRKDGVLFCNWLNACGTDEFCVNTPASMAVRVNESAYKHMHEFNPSVFLMDYPGQGLVNRIIERNF